MAGRFIICKSFEADVRGGAHAALRLSSLLFREIGKKTVCNNQGFVRPM